MAAVAPATNSTDRNLPPQTDTGHSTMSPAKSQFGRAPLTIGRCRTHDRGTNLLARGCGMPYTCGVPSPTCCLQSQIPDYLPLSSRCGRAGHPVLRVGVKLAV